MTSLRHTLIRHLVLGLMAVLLVVGGALLLFLRKEIVQSFDERLLDTARLLSAAVHVEAGGSLDLELGEVPIPEFGAGAPTAAFQIWDGDVPLYRSASVGPHDLHRPALPPERFFDSPLPNGAPGRAVILRFLPTPEEGIPPFSKMLTMMVVWERGTLDARLRDTSVALAAVGVLLLFAMPLVVTRVVRRGLAGLIALGRDVDDIDLQSLDRRLPTTGLHSELVPLAERMNQLLDRVEESVARERRFSGDVAHQLRTPIAELRVLADVSLSGVATGQPIRAQVLEDARDIAVQMERLAIGLLAMARGESGQHAVKAPVDLAGLARRARSEARRRVAERHIRVLEGPLGDDRPAIVLVDQAIIESVVASLVDNAVAYTPPGGEIEIDSEVRGSVALLTVANSDTSLTPDDLRKVFDRFWRKDPARRNGEHSGLGLSVSLALMHAIGGDLTAERPRPGVVRLTVSVPIDGSPQNGDGPPKQGKAGPRFMFP